jgi:hypothetical protein
VWSHYEFRRSAKRDERMLIGADEADSKRNATMNIDGGMYLI